MKQSNVKSKGPFASKFVLITMIGGFSSFSVANAEPLYSKGDWLFGLNAAKVFTNETLDSISAGGAPIPGAGVNITDDTTLSFDVSYFLNSSVALNFFGGLPALILQGAAVWQDCLLERRNMALLFCRFNITFRLIHPLALMLVPVSLESCFWKNKGMHSRTST